MLDPIAVAVLVLIAAVLGVLIWSTIARRRQRQAELAERLQALSDGLLHLQHTLDSRLDHTNQAWHTALLTGLTQLSTQLVTRVDAIQLSVEQRLGNNLAEHNALFRDMAQKLGDLRATNERIVAISQDINQLSRILESPKPRGHFGEFELERMLSNVIPQAFYRLQSPVGEGLADAVILLEGGWLCIDSKFPLDNFRRLAQPDCGPEERQQWRKLFLGDVRRHITDIAQKYILPPMTLDFAIMFIPAETVHYEILLSDEILEFARAKGVVPVSPNTLYAYLQAISIGFRGLKIAQETRRIEQLLLGLKKNFDEFKEHFRLIGRHLDRARGQFIQAENDVSRFDHAIGGIRFGGINDQLPPAEDKGLAGSDANAEC